MALAFDLESLAVLELCCFFAGSSDVDLDVVLVGFWGRSRLTAITASRACGARPATS